MQRNDVDLDSQTVETGTPRQPPPRLLHIGEVLSVSGSAENPAFDILEPHRGEDSVAKAKGLADFADRHGTAFSRIELIRVDAGQVRRLNMNDHRTPAAVLPIQSHDELMPLFDQQSG